MVESMKMCKNFEVGQNSVATEKVMSRHFLNFVAIMDLFVVTKKKKKPYLSRRNFCRNTLSLCCDKVSANI